MSFVSHLECARCGAQHDAGRLHNTCRCGSPLLVRYHLDRVAAHWRPEMLAARPATLWRYHELLPLDDPAHAVTLGEGWTPILPLRRLGAVLGLPHLSLKDEGLNPTGTFKARGAAVGVSRARELGVREFAMPTAGNAGGAWAAYGAHAAMRAHIVMPADAPAINVREALACGADVRLVRGLISDAGRIVARAVARYGWFDVSTLKEPYRIEGKKTMGLEIAEQSGWNPPDVILYPAGGGVGLIGLWKAFDELRALGWLPPSCRPRLVAVQAEGCAPLVQAWEHGREESELWPDAATVASGLRVPKALGDFIVLRAVRETEGVCVAVSDREIVDAVARLAREEGLLVCPEGAATLAAAVRLRDAGWLTRDARVLLLNTGSGLKYPEVLPAEAPVMDPDEDL